MRLFRSFPLLLLFAVMAQPASARAGLAVDPKTCLGCHEDTLSGEEFARSEHGRNACTGCHVEMADLDAHLAGKVKEHPVDCAGCHSRIAEEHDASVHRQAGLGCTGCHAAIHARRAWAGKKERVAARCGECHDTTAYERSVHGQAVRAGSVDAPACHDCHGLHAVKPVGDPQGRAARVFRSAVCMNCHGNEEMMQRNGVFPLAGETFLASYHGKSYRLGFPERAAGCADCHTAHAVLPSGDPGSTIHRTNLVRTCGQCHEPATGQFTKYYAHGDHADRQKYPILWWTFVGMTSLLVGTFALFWIHTLLWMFRGFVENREKQRALAEEADAPVPAVEEVVCANPDGSSAAAAVDPGGLQGASSAATAAAAVAGHAAVADGHKIYRRFETRHILLHLTVVVSFLGLSLTGLPLKFSDQEWARTMMSFYGGVYYAGLIHRACAILTFYYFIGAILMSIDFLFVRKDIKAHWLQRLFGPDSLMPSLRDLRDIKAMVRWFFFRGPKPTFERWTYWEKFDFLAVFWGMFAIGGSGLLLWFPEFFGRFLPGWVFNVATIVHSDEALLATGFIFTVHFFNTHGRPEKFPMDFVIFNGQITKEELLEERGDQWRRYQELGVTEEFRVRKTSGVLYDFFFKGFGFLALFTGLALAFLMLLAFVKG